jgi:tetratricopeptide (TPR) repeat protein
VIATLVFAVLLAGAPAPVHDVAADEARALYVEAKTAYDAGRFDDALMGFQAAFAKKPLPGFLFNLGQCERQLGHHDRAIFFFERYLDEKPDAGNRALVEELIAESRTRLADAAATTTPTTPTATSTTSSLEEKPTVGLGAAQSSLEDDEPGIWPVVAITAVAVTVGVAVGVGIALAVTSSQATLGTHEVTP